MAAKIRRTRLSRAICLCTGASLFIGCHSLDGSRSSTLNSFRPSTSSRTSEQFASDNGKSHPKTIDGKSGAPAGATQPVATGNVENPMTTRLTNRSINDPSATRADGNRIPANTVNPSPVALNPAPNMTPTPSAKLIIPGSQGMAEPIQEVGPSLYPVSGNTVCPPAGNVGSTQMTGTAGSPITTISDVGMAGSPHDRMNPTLTGQKLNIGVNELPAERAVQLSERLEIEEAKTQALLVKIKSLEADLVVREKAINDTKQQVDAATIDVTAARKDLDSTRKEFIDLRERLKKVEQEDIETLKTLILTVEKFLLGENLPAPVPKKNPE
jgi:hypothetical protein